MAPVVLVTGSTDGIGLATARAVGAAGAAVVVHGRDPARVARAEAQLRGDGVRVAGAGVADFADRAEVARLAALAADAGVSVVVNNAGTYQRERVETGDGHELTWAVNHLAPTLLTVLLLDDVLDAGGRVVFVSAKVHGRARLDLADPEFRDHRYSHFHAYANSKLANLLTARELSRRVGDGSPATFLSAHPGVVGTKLLRDGMRVEGHDQPAEAGAVLARLALDPAFGAANGGYFELDERATPVGPGADDALAARLYDLTLAELGFEG